VRALRQDEPLLPIPGEWLGGPDGRRYHILEWVGGGGMGQVFRATDATLHREVALKFLLPRAGFMEEALREARAVARLDHENIVRIFDVSEWVGIPDEPGVPFLVMEYLEGESLSGLLKRGRLEVRRALEVLEGITLGLAHAHERGIVHRDLKPGNVFLTRQGTVKLLDFGLSHFLAASAASAPHLPSAGTPAYMAPEQWRGEAQDARTDVWAAGVVLYEMLTGGVLYSSATPAQLREWVTSEEPVPPVRARSPEVPPEVERLLSTALAKDPARRFPTARQLLWELCELRTRLAGSGFEELGTVTPRRQRLVLLSCQLTGLAGLAGRLDAEELGEVEGAFRQGCEEVIRRHGGNVGFYLAGEVFAAFGCPQVREDDAERAVRTALHLTHDLREALRGRLPHLSLSGLGVKAGLHTGVMLMNPRTLQSEIPQVVSWLARHARPGEVRLSETTWRQVRGVFETEALEPRAFKGLTGSTRMSVHRVLREREVRVRFDRTFVAGGLTPLVGRQPELRRLQALWDTARSGRGAFVLLRGETGIGKSRLIQELREHMPLDGGRGLRFQCWSQPCGAVPPPPVELLQRLLHSSREGAAPRHPEAWATRLGASGLPEEQVRLLGLLLSLPVPEGSPVLRFTPERRLEKTYEALVELLLRVARQRPILLVVEDLHWADSSWLALLGLLFGRLEGARLLVVLSARPEFHPSWPSRADFHRLTLERLPAELATALVKKVAHGKPLPEETVRALVEKTDGIPLFIEEMTRLALEEGEVASIPDTLHELLLARLDRLPSRQKELARLGAVVGRDFSLELLVAVLEREPAELRRELAGLVEAGLLEEQREEPDGPGYQFRHALFQEAAYQSLTRGERRLHHRRIARVLEERFPEGVAARPELLAHHYSEGGEPASAISYWSRAGLFAITRHMAIPEAEAHLSRAREMLHGLPEALRHPAEELEVLSLLGYCQAMQRGFDSPEAARTYARVWELLSRVDAYTLQFGESCWNIFSYHITRAEFSRCYALAEQVLRQGERQQEPGVLSSGYQMRAFVLTYWGRARDALESSKRAMACARSSLERHEARVPQEEERVWVAALTYAAMTHSVSGRLEQGRAHGREQVMLARRLGEPGTEAMVTTYTALAAFIRRDVREALRWADDVIAISSEHSYWIWPAWARLLRLWALAELGQPREAVALISREMEDLKARGLQCARTYGHGALAELHLKLGQVREGLVAVHEGLDQAERTGERGFEVELHRVRGELLRARGREREAREAFFRALAVARVQGALLFELRTVVSLGRLLRDSGRPEAARKRLVRILARFDAGVESVDLQEARALLEQLSSSEGPAHFESAGR
jgi:tetratricopeptide (TPR) repeat protein